MSTPEKKTKDQVVSKKIKDLVKQYNELSPGNELDVSMLEESTYSKHKHNVKWVKHIGTIHRQGDRNAAVDTMSDSRTAKVEDAIEGRLNELIQEASSQPAGRTRSQTDRVGDRK